MFERGLDMNMVVQNLGPFLLHGTPKLLISGCYDPDIVIDLSTNIMGTSQATDKRR